jgi:hypothetical protein
LKEKNMARVLNIGDAFRIIKDAITLFNIKPAGAGGPLPAVYRIDPTKSLWFPKLAVKTRDGKWKPYPHNKWLNTFSADGTELTEKWVGEGSCPLKRTAQGDIRDLTVCRAIFGYSKDASGTSAYRFAGVFRMIAKRDADGTAIYKREADTLTIDEWIFAKKVSGKVE